MLSLFGEFVKFKSTNMANEVVIDPRNNIAQIFNNRLYCWLTLNVIGQLVYIVSGSEISQVIFNMNRAPSDCLFSSACRGHGRTTSNPFGGAPNFCPKSLSLR